MISTRWTSTCLKRDGFVAIRIVLSLTLPFTHWWYVDGTRRCLCNHGHLNNMWYETFVFNTWMQVREAIGPTFNQSYMYPTIYSPLPLNPFTSIGYAKILFSSFPIACNVLSGIRFIEALVSTRARLTEIWFIKATK